MSRSFRKIPIIKDTGKYTYQDKRNANKKVRHTQDLPNGKAYKKVFCSYDISDWSYGCYSYKETANEILEFHKKYSKYYRKDELAREYYRRISK